MLSCSVIYRYNSLIALTLDEFGPAVFKLSNTHIIDHNIVHVSVYVSSLCTVQWMMVQSTARTGCPLQAGAQLTATVKVKVRVLAIELLS